MPEIEITAQVKSEIGQVKPFPITVLSRCVVPIHSTISAAFRLWISRNGTQRGRYRTCS
jgi:hypothetical protein